MLILAMKQFTSACHTFYMNCRLAVNYIFLSAFSSSHYGCTVNKSIMGHVSVSISNILTTRCNVTVLKCIERHFGVFTQAGCLILLRWDCCNCNVIDCRCWGESEQAQFKG